MDVSKGTSSSESDFEDKIEEIKAEIKSLKEKIQKSKGSEDETLSTYLNDEVKEIGELTISLKRKLTGHLGKIYGIAWSGDSKTIVSAAQDGRLLLWNAATGNKVNIVNLKSNWVMSTAFSPDGNMVVSGGLDDLVTIYDVSPGNEGTSTVLRELSGHTGYISSIAFFSESTQLLTSSGDMSIMLWDINTGERKAEFMGHNGDVIDVDLNKKNEDLFISGSVDTTAKLWDIRTGNVEVTFKGNDTDVNSVKYFPDGNSFATGSENGIMKIFDIRASREVMSFEDEDLMTGISSVDFSLSGRLLFGGYYDHKLRVWDSLKGDLVSVYESHMNRISCIEVSPDGYALATGSWDKEIGIWV